MVWKKKKDVWIKLLFLQLETVSVSLVRDAYYFCLNSKLSTELKLQKKRFFFLLIYAVAVNSILTELIFLHPLNKKYQL